MSPWYIFSALGFYPVCPGSDQYALGKPLFSHLRLKLENGKYLSIKTSNYSARNKYVNQVKINGKPISTPFFSHFDISEGGEIEFIMGKKP